ncbi:MAG: YqgE/AlgH family protein [Paracoccaceae bacterium]|nr:YqgE/AlgH family protein [Paracoccaceae bacterium]
MVTGKEAENLTGRLLVAMPGMLDPRFHRAVICMCAHSENGAMGLIVNMPTREIRFGDLLKQLDIEAPGEHQDMPVHFGGPVEYGRGFVLHSGDYGSSDSTLEVSDRFSMTATLDILQDISKGEGPASCLLALGYSGWGPGQVEKEIRENGWLICEASEDLVFPERHDGVWKAALVRMGIDPAMLSSAGGTA